VIGSFPVDRLVDWGWVYIYRKLRNQWQLLGSAMNTPVGVVNIPVLP
jgi:hypothetical protein